MSLFGRIAEYWWKMKWRDNERFKEKGKKQTHVWRNMSLSLLVNFSPPPLIGLKIGRLEVLFLSQWRKRSYSSPNHCKPKMEDTTSLVPKFKPISFLQLVNHWLDDSFQNVHFLFHRFFHLLRELSELTFCFQCVHRGWEDGKCIKLICKIYIYLTSKKV